MIGALVRVEREELSTSLVTGAVATDTVLDVAWVADFSDSAGKLSIEGDVYDYTSTDPETDTITLAAPLPVGYDADTPVLALNADGSQAVTWTVMFTADDSEGEPHPATAVAEIEKLREGDSQAGLAVRVMWMADEEDYHFLGFVDAQQPMDLSGADPTTVPVQVPTEAPTEVITVKGVVGDAAGLTAVATGQLAQTSMVEWYLDGVLKETSTSMVYRFTTEADGDPMALGVGYAVTVRPVNVVGPGTTSPAVTARLNPLVDKETVLAWAAFGFVLAGEIAVGAIRIRPATADDTGGITIPLLNGGIIDLPADGSAAIFKGIVLRATEAIFEDNVVIQGLLNSIEGALRLAAGVTAPTSKPTAVPVWDETDQWTSIDNLPGTVRGMFDNGTAWVTTTTESSEAKVWSVNKTTGVATLLGSAGFLTTGQGAVKIGTFWYVLGQLEVDTIERWNATWTSSSDGRFVFNDTGGMLSHIATDGTSIYLARTAGPAAGGTEDRLIVRKFTTAGWPNATPVDTWVMNIGVGQKANLTGFWVGAADLGGGTKFVATSVSKVWIMNTSEVRQTAQEWARANNDSLLGVSYDGSKFHTMGTNRVWHYDSVVTAVTHSITSTKRDSVGTTHETDASPALSYVQGPRTRFRVTVDPPGGSGGADEPNSVRIYIANKKQTDLAPGVWSATYIVPGTAGAAAPTVNGFIGVASPGSLESGATDADGPLTQLLGDGSYKLRGQDMDDAGEQTVALVGGGLATGSITIRRKNGWVRVRVDISFTSTSGTLASISGAGAIPAELRPADIESMGAYFSLHPGTIRVTTAGTVQAIQSSGANRATVLGSIVYPVV